MGHNRRTMAKTSTTTKLEEAKAKLKEAVELLKAARDENATLRGYYDMDKIIDDIELVTDNPKGIQGHFTTLEDILDNYGDKWFDPQDPDYESKAMEYDA